MVAPSSNWLALKTKLALEDPVKDEKDDKGPKKLRKIAITSESVETASVTSSTTSTVGGVRKASLPPDPSSSTRGGNPDSVEALRRMIKGEDSHPESHLLPGKYISMDCEMVGIAGGSGTNRKSSRKNQDDESSLARVSIVNYYGVVLLDEFVRQRERVTDWRTQFSGIRPSDMTKAKPFMDVQKQVADLLKDRILIGHAVHNDLQCLLLSHPQHMTRDTQFLAGRHGTLTQNLKAQENGGPVKRSKRWALRHLVSHELGMQIQQGEHSSIVDARATMAVYRLHKKIWDKGFRPPNKDQNVPRSSSKRKRDDETPEAARAEDDLETNRKPRGISSGLSVVVNRHKGGQKSKEVLSGSKSRKERRTVADDDWWAEL